MEENNKISIYTPDTLFSKPIYILKSILRETLISHEMGFQLAKRDIKAQYRQAFLGLLWAFITPITNASVWLFIHGAGIVSIKSTGLPYPLFVFTGTMIWAIFMEAVRFPLDRTNSAKSMLIKIYFPPEALIFSGLYQTFFNAAVKILILVPVVVFFGFIPNWHFLFFPLSLLSLIILGSTIGLFITPIGVLYSDVGRLLSTLMQFLMYISPVVYTAPLKGWTTMFFELNPITPIIVTSRQLLIGEQTTHLISFFIISIVSVTCFFIMWIIYRVSMPILIERLGS